MGKVIYFGRWESERERELTRDLIDEKKKRGEEIERNRFRVNVRKIIKRLLIRFIHATFAPRGRLFLRFIKSIRTGKCLTKRLSYSPFDCSQFDVCFVFAN